MNTRMQPRAFQRTLLAMTLSALVAPAGAQSEAAASATVSPAAAKKAGPVAAVHEVSDEVAELIRPAGGVVSVGVGHVFGDDKDRALFGQYSGWRKDDSALLLDGSYTRRNEVSGFWSSFDFRNLGLDNREFGLSFSRQGDWRAALEYSELVRHEPRTINTGLQGIGGTAQTVVALPSAGAGADRALKQERKSASVSAEKWLADGILLDATFKTEDKDGDRLAGVGNYCSNVISGYACSTTQGALLMLVEPVKSTTQQLEINANFSGDKYLVTAGYYGSVFRNSYGSLQPGLSGNLVALDGSSFDPTSGSPNLSGYLTQPIALPPDNQAHQVFLRGNYAVLPGVRTTFNLSRSQAKQDESFAAMGLPAAAGLPSSLGGEVNTTLAQLGLTARVLPNVSFLAHWRYENSEDDTPIAAYNGAFTNTPNSFEKANGKAEATISLPDQMRVTVGLDYAWVKRDRPVSTTLIPSTSMTALRERTEEVGVSADLRRSFAGTAQVAVGVSHSEREGGRWMSLLPGAGQYRDVPDAAIATPNGVFPSTMMDRTRDKARLMVDLMPTGELSIQFLAEGGRDSFSAPTDKGLHSTRFGTLGVDAAYALSYAWKFNAFLTLGEQSLNVDHGAGYIAQLDNVSKHAGLGVVGTVSSTLEIGGNLSFLSDRTRYVLDAGNAVPVTGLPTVDYRAITAKLYGKYALTKTSDLRLDVLYQDLNLDEWSWAAAGVPFVYSDNSTVAMQPNQKLTFLGASYVVRF